MRMVGMRPSFDEPEVFVYEMREGTHLTLKRTDRVATGHASFDLMVDDLHATHERFRSVGLDPSSIESRPAMDHEVFTAREPSGTRYYFLFQSCSRKTGMTIFSVDM